VNGSRPSEARDRVLAQLPPEKQLEVMQRAEKRGPRPDDPDWLLVETMMECAARMEAASPMTAKTLAAIVERLDRIDEQQKGQTRALESLTRRGVGKAAEPIISEPMRYLLAVMLGVLLCIAFATLVNWERILPSPVTLSAAAALGLAVGLGYKFVQSIAKLRR
jgi:uncharacterized membrane protein YccC